MLILRKIKTAYMTLKIQLKARILCKFGGNIEMKKGKYSISQIPSPSTVSFTLDEINMLTLGTDVEETEQECPGLFWRAKVSSYISGGYIGVKKTLYFLKKMSCSGCEKCGWVMEFISEDIYNEPNIDYLEDIEDGEIYTYTVDVDSEDIDIYFVKATK